MALYYRHQEATLGDIEGTGYAFRVPTLQGDRYRGVFIASGEGADDLTEVADAEEVTFSGVLYRRTRSGSVSSEQAEVAVDVTKLDTVALGERVIFEVKEDEV